MEEIYSYTLQILKKGNGSPCVKTSGFNGDLRSQDVAMIVFELNKLINYFITNHGGYDIEVEQDE